MQAYLIYQLVDPVKPCNLLGMPNPVVATRDSKQGNGEVNTSCQKEAIPTDVGVMLNARSGHSMGISANGHTHNLKWDVPQTFYISEVLLYK